jgi:MoaE-MoaD fusion protein
MYATPPFVTRRARRRRVKVHVLFFAVLRERAGREAEMVEIEAGATAAALLASLAEKHAGFSQLAGRIQIAVNQKIVPLSEPLADGDEVALIPPVSGGADGAPARAVASVPLFAVTNDPLRLEDLAHAVLSGEQGGIVTFTGHVRRQGAVPDVERLEYEAYVPMAEAVLAEIGREIELEYPGVKIAIHHRIGTLQVGEAAVVIAAAAAHRAEAFAACRVAIERLKQRAPIWKKEIGTSGAVWVGVGP